MHAHTHSHLPLGKPGAAAAPCLEKERKGERKKGRVFWRRPVWWNNVLHERSKSFSRLTSSWWSLADCCKTCPQQDSCNIRGAINRVECRRDSPWSKLLNKAVKEQNKDRNNTRTQTDMMSTHHFLPALKPKHILCLNITFPSDLMLQTLTFCA